MADIDATRQVTECSLESDFRRRPTNANSQKSASLTNTHYKVSGFVGTITLGSYAFAPENGWLAGGMGVVVFGVNCLAIAYIRRVMWSQD
jgi:hypothetical protein